MCISINNLGSSLWTLLTAPKFSDPLSDEDLEYVRTLSLQCANSPNESLRGKLVCISLSFIDNVLKHVLCGTHFENVALKYRVRTLKEGKRGEKSICSSCWKFHYQ